MKIICFFGIYNSEYSRNRVLISGFKQNGYTVIECNVNPSLYSSFGKYIALYKEYKKIRHKYFEFIIVAFPGHSIVWLARILFGKRIIFDAFVSLYNSEIEDRKMYSKWSLRALYDWLLDWSACKMADKVLLDTNIHIDYFVKRFFLSKDKFIRVFVGTNTEIFFPCTERTEPDCVNSTQKSFIVHFHGNVTSLHGLDYILEAAKRLQDNNILFRFIVNEKGFEKISSYIQKHLLLNIEVSHQVSLDELRKRMWQADICLGIFGNTQKARIVIPNKIYEAIACKKPVITMDSPAIRELFTDKKNMLFCDHADAKSIADKIFLLYREANLKNMITFGGYGIFKRYTTPNTIVKTLLNNIG